MLTTWTYIFSGGGGLNFFFTMNCYLSRSFPDLSPELYYWKGGQQTSGSTQSPRSFLEMQSHASLQTFWVRTFILTRSPECSFLGGLAGKESTCNAGVLGSTPGLGRSPVEGNGYPLHSGLENSMNCIVQGITKSRTRLSDFHFQNVLCVHDSWGVLVCNTFSNFFFLKTFVQALSLFFKCPIKKGKTIFSYFIVLFIQILWRMIQISHFCSESWDLK